MDTSDRVLAGREARAPISLIVAMSRNNVIGCRGKLPWRMSTDLKRFRQLTSGHSLIMGRKTFDSIGRPLPGRRSVVLTSQQPSAFALLGHRPVIEKVDEKGTEVVFVNSLAVAREMAAFEREGQEIFVIGGGIVFSETIHLATRMYVSKIDAVVKGGTRFPQVFWEEWKLNEKSSFDRDDKNDFPHTFCVYDRMSLFDWAESCVSGGYPRLAQEAHRVPKCEPTRQVQRLLQLEELIAST